MIELEKYFDRIQKKIGETGSADEIVEQPWRQVVEELSQTAIECAQELQSREGGHYYKPPREDKPGYILDYEKAPPTRLLSLTMILSYWIGWISQTHGLNDALHSILKAYAAGKIAYDEYKKAEDTKTKSVNARSEEHTL
jgi:hypothetical protein